MEREQSRGIQIYSLPTNRDMQVCPGRASGSTTDPNLLASSNVVPFFHGNFGQMQIKCEEALSVIEYNAIPFKEERVRQNYSSAVDGKNRSPCRDRVIEALVHTLNCRVERPAGTKDIRNRCVDGRKKTA